MSRAHVRKEVIGPITVAALTLQAGDGDKAILVSADLGAIDLVKMSAAREDLIKPIPDFDPESMFYGSKQLTQHWRTRK